MCDFDFRFYDSGYNKQVLTKMKMPNIVAVYNAFQGVLRNAFEDIDVNIDHYNCFCKHNLREPGVFLTKEMTHGNDGKNCIVSPYVVSYGRVRPIEYTLCDDGNIKTDIQVLPPDDCEGILNLEGVRMNYITSSIEYMNRHFHEGDVIVFLALIQKRDVTTGRYYADVKVSSIELSSKDSSKMFASTGLDIIDGCLGVRNPKPGGYAWVHVSSKRMHHCSLHPHFKSTQRMLIVDDGLVNQFSSFEAFEAAAKSYGCKKEDPEKLKNRQNENRPPISPFI